MKTGLKENKWHILTGAISNKICTNCPGKEMAGDRNHILSTSALHIDLETSVSRNWAKLVECIEVELLTRSWCQKEKSTDLWIFWKIGMRKQSCEKMDFVPLNSIQLITWGVERNIITPNYPFRMFLHCIIRVVCLALLLKILCSLLPTAGMRICFLCRVSWSNITPIYQKNPGSYIGLKPLILFDWIIPATNTCYYHW